MTARPRQEIDPDVGIPDLIRRLTDDSKRLVGDEVRLAKLEVGENVRTGARGSMWMALAFGTGVVALVALTIAAIALIGRAIRGHYWIGALVVGVIELGLAFWLIKRGVRTLAKPSYTLVETREQLKDTAVWVTKRH